MPGHPMVWPAVPTCHDSDAVAQEYARVRPESVMWRPAHAPLGVDVDRGQPLKTCWFCGSISCEDLYEAMTTGGVRAPGWADWKYGWPHKLYLEVRNPFAGRPMIDTCTYREGEKVLGAPRSAPEFEHVKFYSAHVLDLVDDETRTEFADRLFELAGILLSRTPEGSIRWAR